MSLYLVVPNKNKIKLRNISYEMRLNIEVLKILNGYEIIYINIFSQLRKREKD